MKSHCCSASASATECEALRALHSRIPTQTGILQPVSQHLSGHWIPSIHQKQPNKEKKGAQSIRFESLIQSAVTALYSPVTVSRTFPFSWSFTVSPSFSLAHFSLSLLPLFLFLPLSLSPSIHSLACSWTEWASTALRNPVSMAVWASKQVSRIL